MKPQTTNKLYEDTNYLQRKVVYRGSAVHSFTYNAPFNVYQSLITDTRKIFSYSNNNFSFDYCVVYNDGTRNRMVINNFDDIDTSTGAPNLTCYAQLQRTTDTNGNQFLTFYTTVNLDSDPGATTYTVYYILYSSRFLDTSI